MPTDDTRSGTLSVEDAKALAADLRYPEWPQLAGRYAPTTGLLDATPDVFTDGKTSISCLAKCTWNGAPPTIKALYSMMDVWLQRLYDQASPMRGSVRIAVMDVTANFPNWAYNTVSWPLAAPIESYLLPYGIAPQGTSTEILQPEADGFRSLRQQLRDGNLTPSFASSFIPVQGPPSRLYALYVRDTTPLENDQGLILPRPVF